MNENTRKLAQDLLLYLEDPESLIFHMLWADQTEEEDLTPQQREDNRRFKGHLGGVDPSSIRLKWNDGVVG